MRLGQLARVVALKPKELIILLEQQGINNYSHANAKISKEDEAYVLNHFGKNEEEVQETGAPIETLIPAEKKIDLTPDIKHVTLNEDVLERNEVSIDDPEKPNPEILISNDDNQVIQEAEQIEKNIELIKAPKVELPGLKVVGKIELPEPPSKEEKKEEEVQREKNTESFGKENRRYDDRSRRKGKKQRTDPNYNPVKAKRDRESKQLEKQRAKQKKKEKQKKAEHYFVKVAPQQAKAKKKKKPTAPASYSQVVMEKEAIEKRNNKKGSFFSRLWKWLNTY